jgi:hypothetical protein
VLNPVPARLRRAFTAAPLALLTLAASFASVSTALAAVAPGAPASVNAVRDAQHPNNFVVSWKPASGVVDHYNVSVFYGGFDHVTTAPRTQTSLSVTGLDATTTYKVTVSSRDTAGTGTTSPTVTVFPLVPSTPGALVGARDATGTTLSLKWVPAGWSGYGPLTDYRVVVTRLADSKVISDAVVTTESQQVKGLDSSKVYSVKVSARNAFGAGKEAIALISSDRPDAPTGLSATRDVKSPSLVHVTWNAPRSTGVGTINGYEVLYGIGYMRETLVVPSASADVPLDALHTGFIAVRACIDSNCSMISAILRVTATGAKPPKSATVSPYVLISSTGAGLVTTETRGYIGAGALYPKLVFRVVPTISNAGYQDVQTGQNGARTLSYTTVPKGTYTVTVAGVTSAGNEQEIARKVIVVNGDGALTPKEQKTLRGAAVMTGQGIEFSQVGENRVLSTRTMTSSDGVASTDVTLKSGAGYAIWLRAGLDVQGRIAGYALQYEPNLARGFVVRQWYKGRECPVALARSPLPAGFAVNGTHSIVAVTKGDTLWATVDGEVAANITSLSAAVAASKCGFPVANGTHIGFRTWGKSAASFTNVTEG